MAKCPKCGKEVQDNKKFCSGCGYKFPDKTEEVSVQQAGMDSAQKEIVIKTKVPDSIKYIIGGLAAIILLVAFPLCNAYYKGYTVKKQFNNYVKEAEFVIDELNTAIDNQYKIDKKYYNTPDALIANVLKKQLKYENLPDNNTRFDFSNGFYVVARKGHRKCDFYKEGAKTSACDYLKVMVHSDETTSKKYGLWGTDTVQVPIALYVNKAVKSGKWGSK